MSKVLWLIDDDELSNFLNKKIIEKTYPNLKIEVFTNAEEAIELLSSQVPKKPNLILLDINMPGISGFDFLKIIEEKNIDTSSIEVHMLSSSINPIDKIKAISFKTVKSYITKPLSIQRIMEFKKIFSLGLVV